MGSDYHLAMGEDWFLALLGHAHIIAPRRIQTQEK
jgi:hypothetical protein